MELGLWVVPRTKLEVHPSLKVNERTSCAMVRTRKEFYSQCHHTRKDKGLMTKNLFYVLTASSMSKREEKQSQLGILLVWDGP